jgi:hypothetical protein
VGQSGGAGSGPTGRRQRAGFSIFLDQVADPDGRLRWETRLYHAESGAETALPGALPEGWIAWIFDRVGPEAAQGAGSGLARAVLELERVEVLDVAMDTGGRRRPVQRLTAEVVVRLTGTLRGAGS